MTARLAGRRRVWLPVFTVIGLFEAAAAKGADYASTILADHPVAYYRLEELPGATTAMDSSPNGFDGTYVYNSANTSPKLGLPGIGTNSISFRGGSSSGSVDIHYHVLLSPTNPDGVTGAPFSAECWAQATSDSLADYTSPLAMSGAYTTAYPNGSGWNFYQTQGPRSAWALFMRGGAVYTLNGPKVKLLDWYHLAVTWDGTNAIFYVDGVSQGTSAIAYKAVDPNRAYDGAIGAGPQTGHGAFAGGVDEVAFYTNVLTASQVLNHYQVGTNSFRAPSVPPAFVTQPASSTNFSGTTATFSVLANGTAPLYYQWHRGAAAVAAATNASYSFTCAYPADDGATFSVTVTNSLGATNSAVVTLTVLTNLNILHDPFGPITRNVGSKAAFRVVANGAVPISYQWFNGTNSIPGATNDTLWLSNVQLADNNTSYHAHLTNPFTSTDSAEATLMVQARAVTVPITTYARVVMADDPVAYWRLDEPSGSAVATDAVGSFDGAYDDSLGSIAFGVATGIPHDTDSAIEVTDTNTVTIGQGGAVRIPYALELNPFGTWTAEAWVRPDSNDTHGNFRTVFSSVYNFGFSTAVYGWAVYQNPNNGQGAWTLVIYNGSGGPSFFGSDSGHIPLVPNSWYHLALTDDGTTLQLYVNGVAGSAATSVAGSGFLPNGVNGDPSLAGGAEVLGQRSDGAFFGFSGGLDDVAFYNHPLTAPQVQAHFGGSVRLTGAQAGNAVVLTWPFGTLQSAPAATGSFTNVPGATSPFTNSITGAQEFFRLTVQ